MLPITHSRLKNIMAISSLYFHFPSSSLAVGLYVLYLKMSFLYQSWSLFDILGYHEFPPLCTKMRRFLHQSQSRRSSWKMSLQELGQSWYYYKTLFWQDRCKSNDCSMSSWDGLSVMFWWRLPWTDGDSHHPGQCVRNNGVRNVTGPGHAIYKLGHQEVERVEWDKNQ